MRGVAKIIIIFYCVCTFLHSSLKIKSPQQIVRLKHSQINYIYLPINKAPIYLKLQHCPLPPFFQGNPLAFDHHICMGCGIWIRGGGESKMLMLRNYWCIMSLRYLLHWKPWNKTGLSFHFIFFTVAHCPLFTVYQEINRDWIAQPDRLLHLWLNTSTHIMITASICTYIKSRNI